MGTIEACETARGKRYRVRYRTPDHRQTDKRGFRTKREAAQLGLRTVLRPYRQAEIRRYRGKLPWTGDLEVMRLDT